MTEAGSWLFWSVGESVFSRLLFKILIGTKIRGHYDGHQTVRARNSIDSRESILYKRFLSTGFLRINFSTNFFRMISSNGFFLKRYDFFLSPPIFFPSPPIFLHFHRICFCFKHLENVVLCLKCIQTLIKVAYENMSI